MHTVLCARRNGCSPCDCPLRTAGELRANFAASREREEWANANGFAGIVRAEREIQVVCTRGIVRIVDALAAL